MKDTTVFLTNLINDYNNPGYNINIYASTYKTSQILPHVIFHSLELYTWVSYLFLAHTYDYNYKYLVDESIKFVLQTGLYFVNFLLTMRSNIIVTVIHFTWIWIVHS